MVVHDSMAQELDNILYSVVQQGIIITCMYAYSVSFYSQLV